ncbi:hypothetical protein I602_299 [Polaribacter dokdonensis DSW-5]|uniref:Uncharacterized protein n=1 Tax=Polaribacter dokdonensis DSW-5 TaxID=1300348 RepID=A0A0M9CEU9_9FLAO|nr:hypothetical protein I602_299 [Polaribacter dokdonensis DSW-5]
MDNKSIYFYQNKTSTLLNSGITVYLNFKQSLNHEFTMQ